MTLSQSNQNNPHNILSQLSQLDKQLISYSILDRQGDLRATVTDVDYTSDGSQYLLIKLLESNVQLSLRRLTSNQIEQLNSANKTILSNLTYEQILALPLYQPVPPLSKTEQELLDTSKIKESVQISLYEEKLKVNRRKRKVGEVVVRKKIETRMIQVPIRTEKLIVERIGEGPEQIAEVVISESKIDGFESVDLLEDDNLHITRSRYLNVKTARQLLQAISGLSSANNAKIRLEIVNNTSQEQIESRNVCDRYQ
jgi:stress response protein YsnF